MLTQFTNPIPNEKNKLKKDPQQQFECDFNQSNRQTVQF
jgi:hypothetical protein